MIFSVHRRRPAVRHSTIAPATHSHTLIWAREYPNTRIQRYSDIGPTTRSSTLDAQFTMSFSRGLLRGSVTLYPHYTRHFTVPAWQTELMSARRSSSPPLKNHQTQRHPASSKLQIRIHRKAFIHNFSALSLRCAAHRIKTSFQARRKKKVKQVRKKIWKNSAHN